MPGSCLKVSSGNNCMKIGNDIGLVRNIITVDDVNYVAYWLFKQKRNFFTYPLNSNCVGIFAVSHLDKVDNVVLLDEHV